VHHQRHLGDRELEATTEARGRVVDSAPAAPRAIGLARGAAGVHEAIMPMLDISGFIADWSVSPFAAGGEEPWEVTSRAAELVESALVSLGSEYEREGALAVHRSAVIEPGAVLKPPLIVGPGSFVAAGAYLRGGVALLQDCSVGPGVEVKSSLLFRGVRLAHFNFVGDSILGADVNLEAGAIIANFRNEAPGRPQRIIWRGGVIETGVGKFGALVGDGVRIGANAVIAPGALLDPAMIVPRLALVDQSADR
jgi:UDP-3-O-[3-hydroxymyristoyl] glucosamine N-acyltransferase